MEPKGWLRVYRNPPLDLVLCRMDQVYLVHCYFVVHFNIILSFIPSSSECSNLFASKFIRIANRDCSVKSV